ncbi:hypothetical protein L2E82_44182 [Cichorium intybus]|uniref:Uncharacterized protein n=1 Tax=Cichorium intybus TaxID=13427 RepID=A0ACB8ZQW3_CICIN|nr:hypothetical protein L2E82_44182 [Cichorium intybus]
MLRALEQDENGEWSITIHVGASLPESGYNLTRSLSNQLAIANESLGGGIVVVMAERYKEEIKRYIAKLPASSLLIGCDILLHRHIKKLGKRREPRKKEKKPGSGIEMPRLREAILIQAGVFEKVLTITRVSSSIVKISRNEEPSDRFSASDSHFLIQRFGFGNLDAFNGQHQFQLESNLHPLRCKQLHLRDLRVREIWPMDIGSLGSFSQYNCEGGFRVRNLPLCAVMHWPSSLKRGKEVINVAMSVLPPLCMEMPHDFEDTDEDYSIEPAHQHFHGLLHVGISRRTISNRVLLL